MFGESMTYAIRIVSFAFAYVMCAITLADVPRLINFQGRVSVSDSFFSGTGQFKFAFVSLDGGTTYWRNAADADASGEPDASVTVTVNDGLYSVALGDQSISNMDPLPADLFNARDVALRVWFSDGVNGFQQLNPDKRVSSVGYAFTAGDVTSLDATRITTGVLDEDRLPSFLERVTLVSNLKNDPALNAEGFQSFMSVSPPDWANGSSLNAPAARFNHSAVWTDQEMIIWGGSIAEGTYSATGYSYRPDLDEWVLLSPINAPFARDGHTAIWTGQDMLVWGGFSTSGFLNTGARFNPSNGQWFPMTTSSAPEAREGHVAVWTGSRLFVWGGQNDTGLFNGGSLYDPVSDQWTAINVANPPVVRTGAVAVWAEDRFIVWGGTGTTGALNTGAQLLFGSNGLPTQWIPTTSNGAPSGRSDHTLVWTGEKMIVWGGLAGSNLLSDGAAYDPAADSWVTLSSSGAPSARSGHVAIWSEEDQDMIVLGGATASGATSSGAAYDLLEDTWIPLSTAGGPQPRSGATAVWTGTDLLVFGGENNGQAVAAIQRLDPEQTWYFYRKF